MTDVLASRRAGVLLHITSLPGATLGSEAYRFVDFLSAGGFSVWQTLPLSPTDEYGSPYCVRSAFAGNSKLLDVASLEALDALPQGIDFASLASGPETVYAEFLSAANARQLRQFAVFLRQNGRWLRPYVLYESYAARFSGAPWWQWPDDLRACRPAALRRTWAAEKARLRAAMFQQYLFVLQWSALKRYANERDVYLFGDLPFYVDQDSVDVWWNQSLFELDETGQPREVAGVPPDYFNADGQLWGNPLYDIEAMSSDGFAWWLARIGTQLTRFDMLRVDHFRALQSYWAVPAAAETAREGSWRLGFGAALLEALEARYGRAPLVAEDLGLITDEVRSLRDRFDLPGMAVLQFGFDGSPDNPHLPNNCGVRAVMYTGTHDNDTTVGWYAGLDESTRAYVAAALGVEHIEVPETFIESVYASKAQLAVVPMQDLLRLASEARMNTPGTVSGNWSWRFGWDEVDPALAAESLARARRYSRCDDASV